MSALPEVELERLLVAVLVGFLIGLDRERAEVRKAHRLFAGVRTFPLIALAGAVPTLILDRVGPWLLLLSFAAVAAIAVVSYARGSAAGDIGATTEIAAVATFLLGVLAGEGELLVAGAAGIGVAILLVAKPPLEAFSRALSETEITAALELAVISVIILPLLPNQGYGPLGVWNPFELWLVVVLVSGLSFAGFVGMRWLGPQRGIVVAGIMGALVSSTAVTVAMANRSRGGKQLSRVTAGAAVLASAIMGLRVIVLTGAINAGIIPVLLPVVAAMSMVGGGIAWWLVRDGATEAPETGDTHISNPFSLLAAMTFGAVYAVILLAVRAAQQWFGAGGMFVAAALSALADVDAISIALARLGPGSSGWREPAAAVTVALVVNTLVKLGIGVSMGAGAFRRYVAVALGLMAVVGVAAAALVARQ